MRNLNASIKEYLSKSTEFAIQIKGNWGYGKTYYYKKNLQKLICETPTSNNAKKNYKAIYISLFGLKSIEDIATKIVLDFYQSRIFKAYLQKKERLKITQGVLKIGLRGFLNFAKLGKLNDYYPDIRKLAEDVLDTSELLICFDDLERKDSALNIEDLLGYINSLVDEGIKVLIVSNDDLMGDSENYAILKEKIIGITIEFIPDTKEVLESIINSRFSTFPVYLEVLKGSIEELVKFSNLVNNNFRHIIYALDNLHHCYSLIKNDIIDCKNDIAEKLNSEIKNISIFILALSVEYKSSLLKYSDIEEFKDDNLVYAMGIALENNQQEKNAGKPGFDKLIEKYDISKKDYHFYESIFNYITAFDEFNTDLFVKEFRKKFNLEKGKILPHYEIFRALDYNNCFDLSDDDYKAKTMDLIDYAVNGFYILPEYLSVMHYVERFDNFFAFDLENICDSLIKGLTKSIERLPLKDNIIFSQFEMTGKGSELSDVNRKLYSAGMEQINLFRDKIASDKMETLSDLFLNNLDDFRDKYYNDPEYKYSINYISFLKCISPELFIDLIRKSTGQQVIFLKEFLEGRFKKNQILQGEIDVVKSFASAFTKYRDEGAGVELSKIKAYQFSELTEMILKISQNPNVIILDEEDFSTKI